jgi:hypothetical protein
LLGEEELCYEIMSRLRQSLVSHPSRVPFSVLAPENPGLTQQEFFQAVTVMGCRDGVPTVKKAFAPKIGVAG